MLLEGVQPPPLAPVCRWGRFHRHSPIDLGSRQLEQFFPRNVVDGEEPTGLPRPLVPGVLALFLGEDLLPWLVLAIGAALAIGTLLALIRPQRQGDQGDLERPPLARSVVMIALGTVAAVWGLASLIAK